MLRSDAQGVTELPVDKVDNIELAVNIDVISEIEKELLDNPYDVISLVFLLYDVPDTALQRLIIYQRVSKDAGCTNLNLLHEWYQHVKSKSTWKHEFVEALLICQLYSIVRKLGFHVPSLMKYYQTDKLTATMYINPLKKVLYKLCESINKENFMKIKKALLTYNIDTTDYGSCELVLLELMCQKFITLNQFQYDKKILGYEFNTDKLTNIIENLPGLKNFAIELRHLQSIVTGEPHSINVAGTAPGKGPVTADESVQNLNKNEGNGDNLEDIFKMLNELSMEDATGTNLKSDNQKVSHDEVFKIKNPERLGVCIIINQEDFYPSKQSIEDSTPNLEKRLGSTIDKKFLEITMSSLKFEVYSESNLDHEKMFEYIKDVTQKHVRQDDSVFMLCMMSHGVKGHVFAADSVKVKVADIQKFLDSEEMKQLRDIPKVFIIQACQVNDTPYRRLVADGPSSNYYLEKSNFLVFWATAPEFAAYRDEKKGSIFILILCMLLKKQAKKEHLFDIFTKINDNVTTVCTKLKYAQVPIFESTLRKKLFLHLPE